MLSLDSLAGFYVISSCSFKGAVARIPMEYLKFFSSACSFICLQALCINFQDLYASLLGDITPLFMYLTFISCFVIDFLSI